MAAGIEKRLGIRSGEITADRKISWEVVADCMGACEVAPMVQLDKDYYGDLTSDKVQALIGKIQEEGH